MDDCRCAWFRGGRAKDGGRCLKSLYGFVWLDFGLDILLRFLMLSYNAVEWGNGSPRLIAQTVDTVNTTLAYCGLFWLMVALATASRCAARARGRSASCGCSHFDLVYAVALAGGVALLRAVLSDRRHVQHPPGIGHPARARWRIFTWCRRRSCGGTISGGRTMRGAGREHPVLILLPALVHGWRSPYRENVAPLVSDSAAGGAVRGQTA